MDSYLLTWNPKRWSWDVENDLIEIRNRGYFDGRWSCGNTKRIKPGDRIYLLRQGVDPKGIVASGNALSGPYENKHWDDTRADKTALFVNVRFDSVLDPNIDGVLPLSRLTADDLSSINWKTQASGISISAKASAQLDDVWRSFLRERGQSPSILPEEVATPSLYFEGASRTVSVNAYERNPRARNACIEYYGTVCVVCEFDFASAYGSLGKDFIHVHHIVPLSGIGEKYAIDPIQDLRPVCPNCHAMLHRRSKVLEIAELRNILHNQRKSNPSI